MNKGKKVCILGAGNVGATIAYTLTMDGMCAEIVLVDINNDKAKGEAMDIIQGTCFCPTVNIYAGSYEDAAGADIVIVTVGAARKPGQSRLDLAQGNVNIVKSVMPQVVKYAPDAVYLVVSNPVDILTYAVVKYTGLPAGQVMGSGTLLDTSRLRARLAEHVNLNIQNVHAYVFGEHGDTSMIPWSLTSISGMKMTTYCKEVCEKHNMCGKADLASMEQDVRTSGAKVISLKGATYYAISLAVRKICKSIIRSTGSVLTVSGMAGGTYGISDVCLSLPFIINTHGISGVVAPPLSSVEEQQLSESAAALKDVLKNIQF